MDTSRRRQDEKVVIRRGKRRITISIFYNRQSNKIHLRRHHNGAPVSALQKKLNTKKYLKEQLGSKIWAHFAFTPTKKLCFIIKFFDQKF